MRIQKFEISAPDGDGEMYASATISVSNPTKDEIRWIQYNVVYLNKDGFALNGSSDMDEYCLLSPGEDIEVSTSDRVQVALAGQARDDITAVVHVTMYTREFFKLGEIDVPPSARTCVTVEKPIVSNTILGPLKWSVYRHAEGSEGRCQLELRFNVQSKVPQAIGRTEFKYFLLDDEEAVVEDSSDTSSWRGGSGGSIVGSLHNIRKSQLRGARVRLTLAVFCEAYSATFTGKSTPSEE